MGAPRPPMDYLAQCSQASLESLELSRLNQATNLRKQFHEILNELIEKEVDARLARALLEWRRAQRGDPEPLSIRSTNPLELGSATATKADSFVEGEQLSLQFQAERGSCEPRASRCQNPAWLDVGLANSVLVVRPLRTLAVETHLSSRVRRAAASSTCAAEGRVQRFRRKAHRLLHASPRHAVEIRTVAAVCPPAEHLRSAPRMSRY
jgi:hypothetical protein